MMDLTVNVCLGYQSVVVFQEAVVMSPARAKLASVVCVKRSVARWVSEVV